MSLKVEVVKPAIGARVYLDRSQIGDPSVSQELLALLERHTVLVFPKIGLTDDEQLALTDALGERVNIAARVPGRSDAASVYQVTLNKDAKIEPEYVLGTFFWHMDGLTVDVPPPKGGASSGVGLVATTVSTFFLTLWTPATLPAFVALFAGLGLAARAGDCEGGPALVLLGVVVGAAAWWIALCCLAHRFRSVAGNWLRLMVEMKRPNPREQMMNSADRAKRSGMLPLIGTPKT